MGILSLISCKNTPVLYQADDSTMADKSPGSKPETGWAEMLPMYFDESSSGRHAIPDGITNNIHVSKVVAMRIAELAVSEILELEIDMKNHIKQFK